MLKLLQNEWMKIWAKKSAWILLVLLAIIVVLPAIIDMATTNNNEEKTWQESEQESIELYKQRYEETGDESYLEQVMISEHRLANDIEPNYEYSTLGYVDYGIKLMSVVTIFTVIIAASIVSSEFSTGTIKMLLTRPVSRAKILSSKLITVFVYGLLLYAFTILLSFITGLVLFGSGQEIVLVVENGQVVEHSMETDIMKTALYSFGNFIMSILFAFMIGSVFRSSSLAIGLTMGITFLSSMVIFFLSKYEIVKYIWITHSDLTQHLTGNYIVEGITMTMSLIVLAVYAIIFLIISFGVFMKRDITA